MMHGDEDNKNNSTETCVVSHSVFSKTKHQNLNLEGLTFKLALCVMSLIFYTDRKDLVQVFAHVVSCGVASMPVKYCCSIMHRMDF